MLGNRQQGVAVPADQRREETRGEPGKVYGVMPLNAIGVRYARGDGKIIREVWYEAGGAYYVPPQSEQFAQALKPVKEEYAKQVAAQLASQRPIEDGSQVETTVDVVSMETAKYVGSNG